MKYIVESITTFRHVHVVEADTKEEAFSIATEADDNWQEFLGVTKLDVNEYTEARAEVFRSKQYFWDGVARRENGELAYKHPEKI
jgi:hypothetical protein